MSAFICDNETITCIARAFVEYGIDFRGGEEKDWMDTILVDVNKETKRIGQALLAENYRSVNFRYREDTEVPEFKPATDLKIDIGTVMGCISCYEYQTCETDDWEDSYIYKDLQRLKDKMFIALLKALNAKMPYGYNGFDMLEE